MGSVTERRSLESKVVFVVPVQYRSGSGALADKGWRRALHDDLHLRNGLNVRNGQITCRAIADALKLPFTPADQALQQ